MELVEKTLIFITDLTTEQVYVRRLPCRLVLYPPRITAYDYVYEHLNVLKKASVYFWPVTVARSRTQEAIAKIISVTTPRRSVNLSLSLRLEYCFSLSSDCLQYSTVKIQYMALVELDARNV